MLKHTKSKKNCTTSALKSPDNKVAVIIQAKKVLI